MVLLVNLFDDESVVAILKIRIPHFLRPDELVWIKECKGIFSVKSAYRTSQEGKKEE
jgi:hypothetical protein